MPLPQAALDHYRSGQQLSVVTIANARRLWQSMGGDFNAGWELIRPRLVQLLTSAQISAAAAAEPYVVEALAQTGQTASRVGAVNPFGLAGVAADGRPLPTLLDGALVATKRAVGSGATVPDALALGGRWLDMAVHTAVRDADRAATSVAITARPEIQGYVRMVNPPACSRCIILAGRWYRYNAGFDRHNRCDCGAIPSSENLAGDILTDPKVIFASLSTEQQDSIFTAAGAKAIRDGADMNQVVNARRGLTVAGSRLTTTEGTTKRGFAGKRMQANGQTVRLMPEAIAEIARDRTEAIELLRSNGFLI